MRLLNLLKVVLTLQMAIVVFSVESITHYEQLIACIDVCRGEI